MELPLRRGLGVLAAFVFLLVLQSLPRDDLDTRSNTPKIAEPERLTLKSLRESIYQDFNPQKSQWLDIPGLRKGDQFFWEILPHVHSTAKAQTEAVLAADWIEVDTGRTKRLSPGELGNRYESVDQLDNLNETSTIVPFYKNLSGYVRGEWVRRKVDQVTARSSLNSSSILSADESYSRNITGSRGRLHIQFDQKRSTSPNINGDTAQSLRADMTIEDTSGDSWEISMKGIHFTDTGSVFLTTSSERFAGVFAIPHLVRSKAEAQLAQRLLNNTLKRSQPSIATIFGNPELSKDAENDVDDEGPPIQQCQYIVYLQQHLVWPFHPDDTSAGTFVGGNGKPSRQMSYLEIIEQELHLPTGRSLGYIPLLRFSATIFSPDCGFVIESYAGIHDPVGTPGLHLTGQKIEAYRTQLRNHILTYSVVLLLQVIVFSHQVKESSTPSTMSRISYYTIAIMTMADCGAAAVLLLLSIFTQGVHLPLVTASFLLFSCVVFLGLKFLIGIWTAQAPEREERERQRTNAREATSSSSHNTTNPQGIRTPQVPTVIITAAGADTLPLPVTARRHNPIEVTQVILPPDQDIDAMLAEDDLLHGPFAGARNNSTNSQMNLGLKFLLLTFCLTMASYLASYWPSTIRSVYNNTVVFCYLSFWSPQIYRNMLRNCRKALNWEFVAGQSILRLIPLGYFYLYTENVLFIKTDPYVFASFIAWQWAQVLLLLSQDVLGPRFFVPPGILPPAYDYHQVLKEGDEEEGGFMPIGFAQDGSNSTGESKEEGKWTSDCIICMHGLEAQYIPRGAGHEARSSSGKGITNIFARRDYMITPCRHIFHTQCLDGWMKYKLQCPICRESLPPR